LYYLENIEHEWAADNTEQSHEPYVWKEPLVQSQLVKRPEPMV